MVKENEIWFGTLGKWSYFLVTLWHP